MPPGEGTMNRPRAPWHPFPLVELCVLAGLVLLVLGLLSFDSERGKAMLLSGMLLGSLGGLDTALREHLAGYRSHTLVLSAFPAVAVAIVAALAGVPTIVIPLLGAAVFLTAFTALRRIWDRTSARTPA